MAQCNLGAQMNRSFVAPTLAAAVIAGGVGRALAEEAAAPDEPPVHGYVLAGVGLPELGHLEIGAFGHPHVNLEATVVWAGLFGRRYGGGIYYTAGVSQFRRPPRHGVLLGARLMFDSTRSFDTYRDELSSYGVLAGGYSFLVDHFYFRVLLGLSIVRELVGDAINRVPHREWTFGNPVLTLAVGPAF